MSAVRTERFGSFLNVDLDPRVAANLAQVRVINEPRITEVLPQQTKAAVSLC